jgi:hypothetical protein
MHRVWETEVMWYNEQVQAQQEYHYDLTRLEASREKFLHSSRMLQRAQRDFHRVEIAAQQRGLSLNLGVIGHQYRHRVVGDPQRSLPNQIHRISRDG